MYNTIYDNIIIGGTYSALGFMLSSGESNLMISQNVYIEDFSPALHFEKISYNTPYGEELYRLFENKELINNGFLNIAEAAIELYKKCVSRRLSIMYNTFVKKIIRSASCFEVECVNSWGSFIIKSKNVINTSPKFNQITDKFYNVLCEFEKPVVYSQDFQIKDTFFDDMKILKINVAPEETFTDARMKLYNIIHKQELDGIKVVLSPTEFELRCNKEDSEFEQIVSCNFSNLIESYEKGWERGLK